MHLGLAAETPSLRCVQVKPIVLELRRRDAVEVEIAVSVRVTTHFSRGRGVTYSMCETTDF